MRLPKRNQLTSLALATVAGIALAACGGEQKESVNTPNQASGIKLPPSIVTDDQLAEEPRGSPENALLRWWQGAQFKDVTAVEGLTSSAVKREFGGDRFDKLIRVAGPALGRLRIVGSRQQKGITAGLRVLIVQYTGGKPDPNNSFPVTLAMREEQGSWRYDDLEYLRLLADSFAPK